MFSLKQLHYFFFGNGMSNGQHSKQWRMGKGKWGYVEFGIWQKRMGNLGMGLTNRVLGKWEFISYRDCTIFHWFFSLQFQVMHSQKLSEKAIAPLAIIDKKNMLKYRLTGVVIEWQRYNVRNMQYSNDWWFLIRTRLLIGNKTT